MVTETFKDEQTHRLLWSHAAQQVIATLPQTSDYDCGPVGCGWGLRHRSARQRTLVIHPSSNARKLGDLAMTMSGGTTHVIPRRGASYVDYLLAVAQAVEAVLNSHLPNHLQ